MRLLLRVVAAPVLVAVTVTGCSRFDAAMGQQQMMVSFKPGTPDSVKLHVRSACGSLPNVHTTPVPNLKKYPYGLSQVIYQVGGASDAQIAKLTVCVQGFPSVAGVTMQNTGDLGS
jgi:hypothetical protein